MAPSSGALRLRRLRERRRAGLRIVPVEVGVDTIETLVARGLIEPDDAADQASLAFALGLLIENICETRFSSGEGGAILSVEDAVKDPSP